MWGNEFSLVRDDCVVELVGLEPTTKALWNMGVFDQLTSSNTGTPIAFSLLSPGLEFDFLEQRIGRGDFGLRLDVYWRPTLRPVGIFEMSAVASRRRHADQYGASPTISCCRA